MTLTAGGGAVGESTTAWLSYLFSVGSIHIVKYINMNAFNPVKHEITNNLLNCAQHFWVVLLLLIYARHFIKVITLYKNCERHCIMEKGRVMF